MDRALLLEPRDVARVYRALCMTVCVDCAHDVRSLSSVCSIFVHSCFFCRYSSGGNHGGILDLGGRDPVVLLWV